MSWATEELADISLGDVRLNNRAVNLLEQMSAQPTTSLPSACLGWNETQAAYRFFDNPKVSAQGVIHAHHAATEQRIQAHGGTLLCVQDTTELDYSGQPQKKGMGPLTYGTQHGMYLHPTLAVTPDRLCLGVLDQLMWARDAEYYGKRTDCKDKSLEEKESVRWVDGYRQVCQLAKRNGQARLVYMADRESDIFDLFAEGETQEHAADYLIRARHNRVIDEDEKISDALDQAVILTDITFDLPRSHKRSQKCITQHIKAIRVKLPRPSHSGATVDSVDITVILAQEKNPPEGEEPITWILVTNRLVDDSESAVELLQWYLCRWQIEIYFRILKSGCKIEKLQLETMDRLQPALALYMIIAWRVLYVTMLGRECPEVSCEVVFESEEWKAAYIVAKKKVPPARPPSLNTMLRIMAEFGGFLNRKNDGEPGPKTIWVGLQRNRDFVMALEVSKTLQTYV